MFLIRLGMIRDVLTTLRSVTSLTTLLVLTFVFSRHFHYARLRGVIHFFASSWVEFLSVFGLYLDGEHLWEQCILVRCIRYFLRAECMKEEGTFCPTCYPQVPTESHTCIVPFRSPPWDTVGFWTSLYGIPNTCTEYVALRGVLEGRWYLLPK